MRVKSILSIEVLRLTMLPPSLKARLIGDDFDQYPVAHFCVDNPCLARGDLRIGDCGMRIDEKRSVFNPHSAICIPQSRRPARLENQLQPKLDHARPAFAETGIPGGHVRRFADGPEGRTIELHVRQAEVRVIEEIEELRAKLH